MKNDLWEVIKSLLLGSFILGIVQEITKASVMTIIFIVVSIFLGDMLRNG